jgi:AraC family transcriptional regulator of adaptative response/methylated-DNA-[protein]-cysteine methyltransferase
MQVSASELHQLFLEWAGTTPERFFQALKIQKSTFLQKGEAQPTLFGNAQKTESLGMGPAHDSLVTVERMNQDKFKNGRQMLHINYRFAESPFGTVIVTSTTKGVCFMAFEEDKEKAISDLNGEFPGAAFQQKTDFLQQNALSIFKEDWNNLHDIKLHLKGTDFQLKVWNELLKIPLGELSTYKNIAERIGRPEAPRAVGTAIGRNCIAYIIPCHRIIPSSGKFGNFKWGG